MSTLELATRAAIVFLVGGSASVFCWFLADVVREARRRRQGPERGAGPDGEGGGDSDRGPRG